MNRDFDECLVILNELLRGASPGTLEYFTLQRAISEIEQAYQQSVDSENFCGDYSTIIDQREIH